MNDKDRPIGERIAATAREHYNPPLATPREEMWAEVASRMQANEVADETGTAVTPLRPATSPTRARDLRALPGGLGWWIGIAAALIIGLGLGRLSLGGGGQASAVAERAAPAGTTFAAAPDETPEDSATIPRPADETTLAAAPPDRASAEDANAATRGPEVSADAATTRSERPAPGTGLPYRVATQKHLDRSESFLAVARSGLVQAEDDPEFGTWARSLLGRTQLLLASPAAREPEMHRLLQDLELMLAQIVVSVETGDPAEARIAGEGLEESDLLLRLRSATGGTARPTGIRRPARSSSL